MGPILHSFPLQNGERSESLLASPLAQIDAHIRRPSRRLNHNLAPKQLESLNRFASHFQQISMENKSSYLNNHDANVSTLDKVHDFYRIYLLRHLDSHFLASLLGIDLNMCHH